MSNDSDENYVRVWLVERTCSDDEQNLTIPTHAIPDGSSTTERSGHSSPSLTFATRRPPVDADTENRGTVDDPELEERSAAEAQRMREVHDPDDVI